MRSRPWSGNRDTVDLGRLFEYTAKELIPAYKDGDSVLLDKLILSPCLFMLEGIDDQPAYAGTIVRARISGPEIAIEYTFEPDIPPILNGDIYRRRIEFDMPHDFEFSRNHWAVKDVDLYRVLLRNFRFRRQRPSVFSISEHEKIEPSLVSVMMPFDASFMQVYDVLQKIAQGVGLRCRRADEIWENPAIIQDIVSLIDRSRAVICDCTGRNPNVFYEIGIAHTLGRDVILITQNPADIPFDLRHLRFLSYLNNAEGRLALGEALEARLTDMVAGD